MAPRHHWVGLYIGVLVPAKVVPVLAGSSLKPGTLGTLLADQAIYIRQQPGFSKCLAFSLQTLRVVLLLNIHYRGEASTMLLHDQPTAVTFSKATPHETIY